MAYEERGGAAYVAGFGDCEDVRCAATMRRRKKVELLTTYGILLEVGLLENLIELPKES